MSVDYKMGGPATSIALPPRQLGEAMKRGARGKCPHCGTGRLFASYVTVNRTCEDCGEEFFHNRSDDLPAYLTILVVGHVVVPLMFMVEKVWQPDLWIHMVLWLPLVVIVALTMLRPIKGAVVGLQWANYMHGFDPNDRDHASPAPGTP